MNYKNAEQAELQKYTTVQLVYHPLVLKEDGFAQGTRLYYTINILLQPRTKEGTHALQIIHIWYGQGLRGLPCLVDELVFVASQEERNNHPDFQLRELYPRH